MYDQTRFPYNPKGGGLQSDVPQIAINRVHEGFYHIAADDAPAADTDGVHAAKACPAINEAAAAVIKAASAETDILTITQTVALGESANELSVLLTTSEADTLAVTKTDETKTINIALAKTTATKNTAALIQAAIRALSTVGDISVAAVVCAAGGDWDTAAIATGEMQAVEFSGGLSPIDVVTTDITSPAAARNATATAGGTAGDIKAVAQTVHGTNLLDEVISEVLPAFTANTPGTVVGNKAFKTITSYESPAQDGLGATVAIGFGDKLGLPCMLGLNTVGECYLNGVKEAAAPTVATDSAAVENNTVLLASALDGHDVDIFMKVY